MGRPSSFEKSVPAIKLLSRRGFTDGEMATALAITEQTFNNWKKQHPDFFESLKEWKSLPDAEVERSLFERATGYTHPETKVHFAADGTVTTYEVTRYYPPDPTSMIFWLKNRQPDRWRDAKQYDKDDLKGLAELIRAGRDRVDGSGSE
jgi:hypothetical protein